MIVRNNASSIIVNGKKGGYPFPVSVRGAFTAEKLLNRRFLIDTSQDAAQVHRNVCENMMRDIRALCPQILKDETTIIMAHKIANRGYGLDTNNTIKLLKKALESARNITDPVVKVETIRAIAFDMRMNDIGDDEYFMVLKEAYEAILDIGNPYIEVLTIIDIAKEMFFTEKGEDEIISVFNQALLSAGQLNYLIFHPEEISEVYLKVARGIHLALIGDDSTDIIRIRLAYDKVRALDLMKLALAYTFESAEKIRYSRIKDGLMRNIALEMAKITCYLEACEMVDQIENDTIAKETYYSIDVINKRYWEVEYKFRPMANQTKHLRVIHST